MVLDIAQELCVSPIFVLGLEVATWWFGAGHATAACTWCPVVSLAVKILFVSWQLKALHLKELFVCQVCRLVQSEPSIRIVALKALHDGFVLQVDSNAVSQLFRRFVVLVVFSCETHKLFLIHAW